MSYEYKTYKLINLLTGESYFCNKANIDGFDYFFNSQAEIKARQWFIDTDEDNGALYLSGEWGMDKEMFPNYMKIIATNNPNIDQICKIEYDEMEKLQDDILESGNTLDYSLGFVAGCNNTRKSNPYNINDMIEFGEWLSMLKPKHKCTFNTQTNSVVELTMKELIESWEETRCITILYYR